MKIFVDRPQVKSSPLVAPRPDTFLARQVRKVLDIIYPRGTAGGCARMIYSGAGNTQNKDGPTEHKPNYGRAA